MDKGSFKTQKEADDAFKFLVKTTVDVLKISEDEAKRRVAALLKTDILFGGHPDDPLYQMKIDLFLQIPSRNHKFPLPYLLESELYQAAFFDTLNNPKVIEQYERLTGEQMNLPRAGKFTQEEWNTHLDLTTGKLIGSWQKFEKFFRDSIWTAWQHHARKN